ncbi:MAG: hypothetical protein E6G13_09065 [Actinobacteria bacterium]|nr:MAG: hypothetical protein E6G13_09065 [Actinomycetota bacterium]
MIETEIRMLLAAPALGEGAPSRAAIEHTLTAGYARAMALEAEQGRLRRRMTDLAVSAADGEVESHASELRSHAARLHASERELLQLRELIAALRTRAAQARAA